MMNSHEAVNKIESRTRGALGILPGLCLEKMDEKGLMKRLRPLRKLK